MSSREPARRFQRNPPSTIGNEPRAHFNSITVETIFKFRHFAASEVNLLLGCFGASQFSRIPMCRGDDVWFVRLSVPAGRYECAFEVDGILYPGGMALVRSDYIELPPQVLHALALTHTCLCQTHKWN